MYEGKKITGLERCCDDEYLQIKENVINVFIVWLVGFFFVAHLVGQGVLELTVVHPPASAPQTRIEAQKKGFVLGILGGFVCFVIIVFGLVVLIFETGFLHTIALTVLEIEL